MIPLLQRWTSVRERVDRPELLDLNEGSPEQVRQSLADLSRIHRWLGGRAVMRRFLFPRLGSLKLHRPIRILDVGAGSSTVPVEIAHWARAHHIEVRIVALDCNERHLAIAAEVTRRYPEIHLLRADVFELPFRPQSFDFVVSTLLLHHFDAESLHLILSALWRVCGRDIILNDLIRDRVPALFFRLTMPFFARSHLTRHDGCVSIFRAYTPPEMRTIVTDAGFEQAKIYTHGLYYRMTVLMERRTE